MVSIVIPVAKEGEALYERILSFYKSLNTISKDYGILFEVVLVTDVLHIPTLRALIKLGKEGIARSLLLTHRIGKGGSIKNAVPYTHGEYIVLLDADIPISPKTIVNAVLLASRYKLDLLIANRVYRSHGVFRKILSIAYNTLVNIFFRTGLCDHQAGFKILSRRAAKIILVGRTRTDDLAYDTEVIVWAKRHGFKYRVINVVWIEQRQKSTIPSMRALLTMLADIVMLRLLTIARKYIALQRLVIGHIIELNSMHTMGLEFMTVVNASGLKRYLLDILRKLYIAIAFRGR